MIEFLIKIAFCLYLGMGFYLSYSKTQSEGKQIIENLRNAKTPEELRRVNRDLPNNYWLVLLWPIYLIKRIWK